MMGSTMKYRPVTPPPGVNPAAWHAQVEQQAQAQLAYEKRLRYLRRQDARLEARARRRRTRLLIGALLAVCVLLATVGVGWTAVALVAAGWWKAGHPGLDRARQGARSTLDRRVL